MANFAYPKFVAFVKGAPDVILDHCSHIQQAGAAAALTEDKRKEVLDQNRDMASSAQVMEALKVARGAGLKSIMVTGDYKDTAEAIAREIGLLTKGGLVLTGPEIEKLSDEELAARTDKLEVCCRVSPQHKTRIVDALKARGHVVAMTGDGVNDAPALALGMEKGDPDIMKRPPRPPKEPVINRDMAIGICVIAVVDAIAILLAFYFALQRYPRHLAAAQTIAFVTLCTSELLRAYTARSEYHSVFSIGVFSNKWMNWAVLASFLLVLAVVYVPFLRPFFDTVPLTLDDWFFMLPFFFASPIAMEVVKLYFRRRTGLATAAA